MVNPVKGATAKIFRRVFLLCKGSPPRCRSLERLSFVRNALTSISPSVRSRRFLRVTHRTLRNWDKAGKLPPIRHPFSGYRLDRREDLETMLNRVVGKEGKRPLGKEDEPP